MCEEIWYVDTWEASPQLIHLICTPRNMSIVNSTSLLHKYLFNSIRTGSQYQVVNRIVYTFNLIATSLCIIVKHVLSSGWLEYHLHLIYGALVH